MSTLTERLLSDFEVFDYATVVAAHLDSSSVPDPVSYSMDDDTWSAFAAHLEAKEFDYTTESMAVLKDLEEVLAIEQYDQVASEAMADLTARLEPNVDRDLALFKSEIKQALEEEVVLRFHLAAGMVERSLSEDPTVLRAQAVFGPELTGIIGNAPPAETTAPKE